MTLVYFDASALSKGYVLERGTGVINHIFRRVPPPRRLVLAVGVGEVLSVLLRRRNGGQLSQTEYVRAAAAFRAEVVDDPDVVKVEAAWDVVERSLPFIEQYGVNATDAIVLRTALDLWSAVTAAGDDVLLVACDRRLTSAATAEGLPVFDPEHQPASDFDVAFTR